MAVVTKPKNIVASLRRDWSTILGSAWVALLFFGLAAAFFTWPLVTQLDNTLPNWNDPAAAGWLMGQLAHQLVTNPFQLYYTTGFHPFDQGLVLNELLTGPALLAAPLYWLTANPVLSYNLLNFLAYALSGWSMWLLIRKLTGSPGAGLVAGLIYAFSPWHSAQYDHLALASQQWLILAVFFLLRFLENSRPPAKNPFRHRNWLNLLLFITFGTLQALTSRYFIYFEAILFLLFLAYYFLFESGLLGGLWRKLRHRPAAVKTGPAWPQLLTVGLACLVILLLTLPFLLPYADTLQTYDFKHSLAETINGSATPTDLLRTLDRSWLYNPIERTTFGFQTTPNSVLYPGIIALLLAILGLKSPANGLQPARRWVFLAVALVGLLLSFGPTLNIDLNPLNSTGLELPYRWLYHWLPGFDSLPLPYQFGQLFMLGLAALAGYGAAYVLKSWPRLKFIPPGPWLLLLTLCLLLTADYFAPGFPARATPTGEAAPAVYRWLAGTEAAQVIERQALLLELPLGDLTTTPGNRPMYLLYSLAHARPMLNGSADFTPPGYDRLCNEMQNFPNAATLDLIEGLQVKFIIVHTAGLASEVSRAELDRQAAPDGRLELVKAFPASEGDPRFKDLVYRVKANPQRFARLAALIPPGAEVLLADQSQALHQPRLYTAVIPSLIGLNRQYFSTYSTIYDPQVQPAQPNRVYDYAIFYRNSTAQPTEYGYNPTDLVPLDDNDVIQLYHKRTGLTSFFSFQDDTQPGHYLPFSAQNSVWLGLEPDSVKHIPASDSVKFKGSPGTNQTLTFIIASAEPQTIFLRSVAGERKLSVTPGFYRWQVNIATPNSFELTTDGPTWAYLVQARLLTTPRTDDFFEQIKGAGGAIAQASSQTLPDQPGVIVCHLLYYTQNRLPQNNPPNFLFQVNIATAVPTDPSPSSVANPTASPSPVRGRRFGEWSVTLPPAQPGVPYSADLRLNLLEQKAEAQLNGKPIPTTISMPLSTADGIYDASLYLLIIPANQPIQASPLNADTGRFLNTFKFRLSHPKNQPAISQLQLKAPNAFISLPSVNN